MSADWRCHLCVAEPVAVGPAVSIAVYLSPYITKWCHFTPETALPYCAHTLQRNALETIVKEDHCF